MQIADGTGSTVTKTFQLQIVAAPSITTTSPLPGGTVNSAYSLNFTETGGVAPFQWTGSGLPAGLNLTTAGLLSGSPTSAGTSNIVITLTDAAGATASGNFSLTVVSGLAIASTSPLPTGTVGSSYSFTFQASGGSGSYTWSVASGSLPAGLSLNASSGLTVRHSNRRWNGQLWNHCPRRFRDGDGLVRLYHQCRFVDHFHLASHLGRSVAALLVYLRRRGRFRLVHLVSAFRLQSRPLD